ncbi:hypothetical protein JHK82_040808 [Glycine max]|nr:hypothetical protein JHK82_040808 [Glycine max]
MQKCWLSLRLHKRKLKVSRLQDQECKDASCDQDIQIRIPKLKDLESKAKDVFQLARFTSRGYQHKSIHSKPIFAQDFFHPRHRQVGVRLHQRPPELFRF